MGERVQLLAVEDSFDANGTFVPAGQVGSFDTDRLNGKEPHLTDIGDQTVAVVEIAPLGPTGSNPTQPQQIPPEARQGPGGQYVAPGRRLVGEVTNGADIRFADISRDPEDTSEGDLQEELRKAEARAAEIRAKLAADQTAADTGQPAPSTENSDDALVGGTVAEITASLGEKTDDELNALRAAEIDREKPRKGVLDAIKAEQASRQG